MGHTKAAVFPVPVCAQAIKSFPDCMTGMASCCIGVGCLNPMDCNPSSNVVSK